MANNDECARKTIISVIELKKKEAEANKTNIEDDFNGNVKDKGPTFGCRHVQAILLCLLYVFGIGTRINIALAIVAMTNRTSSNPEVPVYSWNNTGVILSSFYWSFISVQILAGYLGKRYGPKYFLLVTFFINSCAVAATPFVASKFDSGGVILCRIVQGFTQGFLDPSVHVMLGTWVPDEEKSTLSSFVFTGVAIGSILATILTGYLSVSWYGWPYSFYILALLGFIWCVLWAIFGQNSPTAHPRITEEEKRFIQNSLRQGDNDELPTPWKKILTCIPFYAIMIAYVGNYWGYTTLSTEGPTYLSKIMNFNVKSNAILNSLPTLASLVIGLMIGPLSDWIISQGYLSRLNARRTFQVLACFVGGLCFIWLSFLNTSQPYTSVLVITISLGIFSFVLAGSNINHLDLSPRFSGVIFGIINTIGQLASIASPLFAQWILEDQTNIIKWRIVFLTSAGFYIVCATVFAIFASAERQPWDGSEI